MTPLERKVLPRAAFCAYWDPSTLSFSTKGCTTLSVDSGGADCACHHLATYAVIHNRTVPVCGNGILQLETEACDDGDWPPAPGDGCDAECRVEGDYTCYGEPSRCISLSTPNTQAVLDQMTDGVRAELQVSGYASLQDFLPDVGSFASSVAQATSLGIAASDVLLLRVCFGRECSVIADVPSRRALAAGGWGGGRGLLQAEEIAVTFHVNAAAVGNSRLLAAMSSSSMLQSFASSMSDLTSR